MTGNPRKGSVCRDALVAVATVTVTGVVLPAGEKGIEFGLIEQVVPVGAPEHANVAVPLNVLTLVSPRLYVAVCPATTVAVVVPLKKNGASTVTTCAADTAEL